MRETGKVLQALYDEVIAASDSEKECDVCITLGQARWILSQVDYAGWKTRYYTLENLDINQDKIDAMRDDLIERLFMTCCGDIQQVERRVNPDTGIVEVSTNGGATWVPDPDDPRNSGVALPPPVTSGTAVDKCAAANSVTRQLQVYVDDIINSKNNTFTIVELALAIAAICLVIWVAPAWALLPGLIIPLVQAIFAASVAELTAAMSTSTYQQFACIIYCNMQADGSMTQEGYTKAINDMNSQMSGGNPLGYNTCRAFMLIYGLLGVNNSAAQGLNYGFNCDGCTCGACDLSTWTVSAGTLVSQSETEIIADAIEQTPGDWTVQLTSPSDNSCCCGMTYELLSGASPTAVGYVPCGLPVLEGNISFSYAGGSLRWYDLASHGGTFRVRITASDC